MDLIKACEIGNLEEVKRLVEGGENIHVGYEAALKWAAFNGRLGVVKYLIEKGADIEAAYDDALVWASSRGQIAVVELLLEAKLEKERGAALVQAVKGGHIEIVKLLLEQNVDAALKEAVVAENEELVGLLLENNPSNIGEAVKEAILSRNDKIVIMLLEKGIQEKERTEALITALSVGDIDIVKMLINKEADLLTIIRELPYVENVKHLLSELNTEHLEKMLELAANKRERKIIKKELKKRK
jgi:ankyrin repeat protein